MRTANARGRGAIAAAMALLATILLPAPAASAQDRWSILNYEISLPVSETADFIDTTSYRGIGIEGRWFQGPNTSLGFSLDWTVLFENTDDAITVGNATVSGTQDRTINVFPMLVTGHYYLGPDRRFFAGLGAGLYFKEQRFDIGIFSFDEDAWHPGIAPEIGISYPVGYTARAILALRYNYGFEVSDLTLSYWSMKLGIAW